MSIFGLLNLKFIVALGDDNFGISLFTTFSNPTNI